MGTRVTWMDLFYIEETAALESRSSFNTTNGVGVGDGIFRALLRTTPTFNYPNKIKYVSRSSGFSESYSGDLIESVNSTSNVNYSFNLDSYLLSLFQKVLFQGGTQSTSGSYYIYTSTPYTSPTPSHYLATVRATPGNGDVVSNDRSSSEIWGGLVTSLSISGSSGGLMDLGVTIAGARYNRTNIVGEISNDPRLNYKLGKDGTVPSGASAYRETSYGNFTVLDATIANVGTDANFTDPDSLGAGSVEISNSTGNLNFSSADITSYSGQNISVYYNSGSRASAYNTFNATISEPPVPLKFQDVTIKIDGSEVDCNELNFSTSCGIQSRYYEERNSYDFFLGRLNSMLTLNIPFGDTNFGSAEAFYDYMGESDHYINIYWGTSVPSADNHVALNLNGKVKSPGFGDSGGEVLSTVQFELMNNTTYESVEMRAAYYSSKLDRS